MSDLYKEYRSLKQAKENGCSDKASRCTEPSRDTSKTSTAPKVPYKTKMTARVGVFMEKQDDCLCRNQNVGVPI